MLALDDLEAADAAADVDADAFLVFRGDLEARCGEGVFTGGNAEVNKPSHLFDLFLLDEPAGIEILDLTSDLTGKRCRIELLDSGNPAFALQEGMPSLLGTVADGGEETNARNDYSSRNTRLLEFL